MTAERETTSGLSLAEEVLLIAFDAEEGADRSDWGVDSALAGAVLLDLGARGCLCDQGAGIVAADCDPPADPLLGEALLIVRSSKPRGAREWVERLPTELGSLRDRVARGLVERGILEERRRRVLGLFPAPRYPERDPEPERRLRERMRASLLGEREPSTRDALLVSLLAPHGLIASLVPKDRGKEATENARAIADRGVLGPAVENVVRDLQAATIAATTTSVASTGS